MGRVFRVEKELQRSYPRAWNQGHDLHRFRLFIVDTVIRHMSNSEIREHTIHTFSIENYLVQSGAAVALVLI